MLPLPIAPRWLAVAIAAAALGGVLTGAIWNAATRSDAPIADNSPSASPSQRTTAAPQPDGGATAPRGTGSRSPSASPTATPSGRSAAPTRAPAPTSAAPQSTPPAPEPSPSGSEPTAPSPAPSAAPAEQPPPGAQEPDPAAG